MSDLITMLRELILVRFPEEVSVLLCINFNRRNLSALHKLDDKLIDETLPQIPTTMFFKITTISDGHPNILRLIAEKEDFQIDEEKDLSDFFKERVLRYYEAERYLMFTWDHSNGFEIFSKPDTKFLKMNNEKPALTMDELAQAISWSMNGRKIDLVIMMNCYMQQFDTGYALRNDVKYLVATQTSLGFLEYDYLGIFLYLARKPDTSPRDLSEHVLRSFRKKATVTGTGESVAMSVWRLKHFGILALQLNQLATRLYQRLPRDFEKIREAFLAAHKVHGQKLLDLYSLLTQLSLIGTAEEQILINQIFLLKNRGVYKRYIDTSLFASYPKASELYNGISILSPLRVAQLFSKEGQKNLEEFLMRSLFLKESEWGKLFRELEQLDSPPHHLMTPAD